jgi:hypothetical protein
MNQDEFLKRLHNDPNFKKILGALKDEKERNAVREITEKFYMSFYDTLSQAYAESEKDPEGFKSRLAEGVVAIVNVSGSAGQ